MKHLKAHNAPCCFCQPPSGGCVLKLGSLQVRFEVFGSATFRWLCVETLEKVRCPLRQHSATFRWLCVETRSTVPATINVKVQPPSGGCVLKPSLPYLGKLKYQSATFRWLCVETRQNGIGLHGRCISHLQVAVC